MTYKEYCKEVCGYDTISTFFDDFSKAEEKGFSAIMDKYRHLFNEWKHDYKMFTELVMVLNHKVWLNSKENEPLALFYDKLWRQADNWGCENLKGEELEYYYRTLD